jgi:hypothetical protein
MPTLIVVICFTIVYGGLALADYLFGIEQLPKYGCP